MRTKKFGQVFIFLFILSLFGILLTIINRGISEDVRIQTKAEGPTEGPCRCKSDNTCASTCQFQRYDNVTYHSPIKCMGDTSQINSFCTRTKRLIGDTDGNDEINRLDYFYYLRSSYGFQVLPGVLADVNGDGSVTLQDRSIIVQSLTSVLPTVIISPSIIPSSTTAIPSHTPVPTLAACPTTSTEAYATVREILSDHTTIPAAEHPDLNIQIRGYTSTTGDKQLVDISGPTDPIQPPLLSSLISNTTLPEITHLYKVYDWEWAENRKGNLISSPSVTMIGLAANPGDVLKIPLSGYDIGLDRPDPVPYGDGYAALVLYATGNSLTIKYTRHDNVMNGYTLHVDSICTNPNLLRAYEQANSNGRTSYVALKHSQIIGVAPGGPVGVAIRADGAFMDPRSRKDWWE